MADFWLVTSYGLSFTMISPSTYGLLPFLGDLFEAAKMISANNAKTVKSFFIILNINDGLQR